MNKIIDKVNKYVDDVYVFYFFKKNLVQEIRNFLLEDLGVDDCVVEHKLFDRFFFTIQVDNVRRRYQLEGRMLCEVAQS